MQDLLTSPPVAPVVAGLRSDRGSPAYQSALGDALREHGHLDPLEEVMTVAFDGLREAGVATRTACTLTGRARASHYRRLRPPPVRRPPIPQSQRKAPTQALSPAERVAVLDVLNTVGNADLSIGRGSASWTRAGTGAPC